MIYLFFLTAAALGYMEAILFHIMNVDHKLFFEKVFGNIHNHFNVVRVAVFLFGFGINLNAVLCFIPCALMFPLFHDEAYYVARHYFDHRRFSASALMYHSPTTNAKYSFDFTGRCLLFVLGLSLYIIIKTY